MSWTDERIELLKALWADGLSATQIAGELGGRLTRNAIIGKIHRLGLQRKPGQQADRNARAARHGPERVASRPAPLPELPPPIIVEVDAPPSPPPGEAVSLLELGPRHCRTVLDRRDVRPGLGKGLKLYCGKPKVADYPYCSDCCAAYGLFKAEATPAQERRPYRD